MRSQKKRQTLDSRRREGEEGGGVRRAGATHRKAWEMSRETKKPTAGGEDMHLGSLVLIGLRACAGSWIFLIFSTMQGQPRTSVCTSVVT